LDSKQLEGSAAFAESCVCSKKKRCGDLLKKRDGAPNKNDIKREKLRRLPCRCLDGWWDDKNGAREIKEAA
jgi:hypothetical protein